MKTIPILFLLAFFPVAAGATEFNGAVLNLWWALPFAGMLLSIALMPLLAAHFWHQHFGKVSLAWALSFLGPFALQFGVPETLHQLAHTLLLEYLPFIVVLFTLFTISGGICVRGNLHGSPAMNTCLLAIGTGLTSIIGTTGAAMLLIRPLVRANDNRKHKIHTIIFFIFLVGNAGGALTPLGDPPLFLGFLKGVDFFWTTRHMLFPTLFLCLTLLALFYALDSWFYYKAGEERPVYFDPTPDSRVHLIGKINFALIVGVVSAVLMSGLWKSGISWEVMGTQIELQNLLRDVVLIILALVSLIVTPKQARVGNDFNWAPILEVAKLFIGIFVTIIPVIAMLHAGEAGALSAIEGLVTRPDGSPNDAMYFWLTGLLSSFLDNAPTYLVFFNLAGGDPSALMHQITTLEAISSGAVFMGAITYIGNAPNFMIKSIAENSGIRMPSFFGYMAWSVTILVPLFVVMSLLFYR